MPDEAKPDPIEQELILDEEEPAPRRARPIIYFGGNVDRVPTRGFRKILYDLGFNLGATDLEIIEVDRRACIERREQLRKVPGCLCIGVVSTKGGVGKSTLSTLIPQMLYDMNPGMERPILIDVNTSVTTLDELNGIPKEKFLKGEYWTMKSLYDYIQQQGGDIDDFNFLLHRLAYRRNPQLPVIPLRVEAGFTRSQDVGITGQQYETVLRVLKKHFTVIVHDFGTDLSQTVSRAALSHIHMLGVVTHTGQATLKTVPETLGNLRTDMPDALENTVVILNNNQRPPRQAAKAIAREKAAGLDPANDHRLENDQSEVMTRGVALSIINRFIDINQKVYPLEIDEISLVGFDSHLRLEQALYLNRVQRSVQAQLWTLLYQMFDTRARFEAEVFKEHKFPEGTTVSHDVMSKMLPKKTAA